MQQSVDEGRSAFCSCSLKKSSTYVQEVPALFSCEILVAQTRLIDHDANNKLMESHQQDGHLDLNLNGIINA
jgi:hypothetical protein